MIEYKNNLASIDSFSLDGFFVGWPNPPNSDVFRKVLKNSYKVIYAIDDNKLVGFINAISDGVLSAYIPLLEVLPEHQGRGIGKKLVQLMQEELSDLYMIDLLCDKNLLPFYENLGMKPATGVLIRNYDKQNGVP